MIHNVPQPQFEEFIAEALKEKTNVEIHKNVSFVSLIQVCIVFMKIRVGSKLTIPQDNGHVLTTVENGTTGSKYCIRSKHMVACDGARSHVRTFLGVESEGDEGCKQGVLICSCSQRAD
jgi:2-polyprenyl-6-methoxyphenol hydroxylase-like FAD-dependent oxidoreductase